MHREKYSALLAVAVIIIFLSSLSMVGAATILVSSGQSIQAAINGANPEDTISVQSGVYRECLNITKPVFLVGQGRPLLDGGAMGSAIVLRSDGTSIIGFDIRTRAKPASMSFPRIIFWRIILSAVAWTAFVWIIPRPTSLPATTSTTTLTASPSTPLIEIPLPIIVSGITTSMRRAIAAYFSPIPVITSFAATILGRTATHPYLCGRQATIPSGATLSSITTGTASRSRNQATGT